MSEQTYTIQGEELRLFCAALFMSEGVPEDEARITADVLVEANLTGMDSHGVSRVAAYMERLRQGGNRRAAKVDVLADFPAGATWDANGSMGQVVAYRAMRAAMDKARELCRRPAQQPYRGQCLLRPYGGGRRTDRAYRRERAAHGGPLGQCLAVLFDQSAEFRCACRGRAPGCH